MRVLADADGDGRADIVAFGTEGVFVARSTGNGFEDEAVWLSDDANGNRADFVLDTGYRVNRHSRGAADIDGDGRADLWAIGAHGVLVALSTGDLFEHVPGTWYYESRDRHLGEDALFNHFTEEAGWSVQNHPRFFGDVDGNGMADLVGFHDDDVLVSLKASGAPVAEPVIIESAGSQVDLQVVEISGSTGGLQRQFLLHASEAGVPVDVALTGMEVSSDVNPLNFVDVLSTTATNAVGAGKLNVDLTGIQAGRLFQFWVEHEHDGEPSHFGAVLFDSADPLSAINDALEDLASQESVNVVIDSFEGLATQASLDAVEAKLAELPQIERKVLEEALVSGKLYPLLATPRTIDESGKLEEVLAVVRTSIENFAAMGLSTSNAERDFDRCEDLAENRQYMRAVDRCSKAMQKLVNNNLGNDDNDSDD